MYIYLVDTMVINLTQASIKKTYLNKTQLIYFSSPCLHRAKAQKSFKYKISHFDGYAKTISFYESLLSIDHQHILI